MTGLDKIIEKINSDSADACSKIINDAQAQASQILKKAESDCAAMLAKAKQDDELAGKKALELAESAAQQRSRQEMLSLKIKAINDVINDSLYALEHLPDGEYFGALIRLIETHSEQGKCELLLRDEDISRKPADFDSAAVRAAAKNGCELTIASSASAIAPGVVLKYGDIEIDCTFRSLIDEMREELKEAVNEILF